MKRVMGYIGLFLLLVVNGYGFGEDPFGYAVQWEQEAGTEVLDVAFTVPEKHYLYADELEVTAEGATLEVLERPEPDEVHDPYQDKVLDVFPRDFTIRYRVVDRQPEGATLTISYMGCNDALCFMPQTHKVALADVISDAEPDAASDAAPQDDMSGVLFEGWTILGMDAGYRNESDFLAFLERVSSGRGMEARGLEALVAGRGIWIGLLAILLGGLALNLTPCVLPMIPINIAIIGAGAQAGSRGRGFFLGTVYGAGIALVYGILGVVVVLTGAQFGALNANPWFNIGIGSLFLLLALAMFDVFQIDFSRFQGKVGKQGQQGSVGTAFLFGGVAALLAGACVAPVVISVLILSTGFYQEGHRIALFLPFVLGIGMALPWPFAGAGLSFLPKPGRWMDRVKKGFGVLILGAALYYGYLGVSLLQGMAPAETSGPAATKQEQEQEEGFWLHDPEIAVARVQETGKPLFVDFWATWCKNCLAMDRTTFQEPAVREALAPYVRLKFQAEDPTDPDTKRVLDQLGVKGLPSYVILQP